VEVAHFAASTIISLQGLRQLLNSRRKGVDVGFFSRDLILGFDTLFAERKDTLELGGFAEVAYDGVLVVDPRLHLYSTLPSKAAGWKGSFICDEFGDRGFAGTVGAVKEIELRQSG
jgi:hypothetical protein